MMRRHFLHFFFAVVAVGMALAAANAAPVMAQGGCDRFVLGIDTSDTTDCSDEVHPCRTIQYAINQAAPGDVICVASHILAPKPLVYPETLTITKTVTLDGAWEGMCVDPSNLICNFDPIPCAPENIVVDAGGTGRTVTIDGSAAPGTVAPVIDCLTITGGDADGLGGDPGGMDAGGGVFSVDAAPIIANSVITANYGCDVCSSTYGRGGGIYLLNAPSTSVIRDSVIANNVADDGTWLVGGGVGGGILLQDSDALVRDNVIRDNRAGFSAGYGGGIAIRGGTPTVAGNDILYNIGGQAVQGLGGGIYVWSTTPATVVGNTIRYNQAIKGTGDPALQSMGGGIYYAGNPTVVATIRDNEIAYNLASPLAPQTGLGGGIHLRGLSPGSMVSGNTIEWNVGGFNDDGNGGGIYVEDCEVTIADNVLESNAATWSGSHGEGGGVYVGGGAVLISTNVITGNAGGYFPGLPSTATGLGGGIAAFDGDVVVSDNDIVNNDATNGSNWGWGGGVYVEGGATQILANTIANNTGGLGQQCFGGGVAMTGTVGLVRGNRVLSNTATLDQLGSGGGIFGDAGTYLVAGNVISGNLASVVDRGYGGGVTFQFNTVTLEGNTILDNVASPGNNSWGGGVRIGAADAFTLTNNVIARNAATTLGSGVAILGSDGLLVHNTVVENTANDDTGIAVQTGGVVMLTNNLIARQTVGIDNTAGPAATVTAERTMYDTVSTHSIDVMEVASYIGSAALLPNYRLTPASDAIDEGVSVPWVARDIDLDTRPHGKGPDVGADEFSCLASTRAGSIWVEYDVVQDAIDAAGALALVKVAEGTCFENLSIAKTITLEGGWSMDFATRYPAPAAYTTIDGLGAGRVISITEPPASSIAPVIDGLTLTGGDATGLGGSTFTADIGGGIYGQGAEITVRACTIRDNVASTNYIGWGGGIGTYQCDVILEDNVITSNIAALTSNGYGGGVALRLGKVELSGNQIEDNVGASGAGRGWGGGIWLASVARASSLQDNVVRANVASAAGEGRGGGIDAFVSTSVLLDGDIIENNIASGSGDGYGGGIGADRSGLDLSGVQLIGNQANTFGGGLYVLNSVPPRLQNCDLVSNTAGMGGGFYLTGSSNALIAGSHIHGNSAGYGGGGISFAGDGVVIRDSRICDNDSDGLAGGLWLDGSSDVQLLRNWITGNRASAAGGVFLMADTDALLVNNVVADNAIRATGNGAGLLVEGGSARLLHTTLARNVGGDGSGIHVMGSASVWMTNTIAVSHTVAITVASGSSVSFASNLWGFGAWANGMDWGGAGTLTPSAPNIHGDPDFIAIGAASYHIGPGSAALDAGIDAGITDDIDGNLRPMRHGFDIGADETMWVCLPIIMKR